jgi:hypothetical protein
MVLACRPRGGLLAAGAGQRPGRGRAGAQQFSVVADDGHLGAVHPQGDTLAGEFVADIQLHAGQADQAGAIDHPLHLDRHASGRQRRRPGWAGAVGGEAGQLGDAEAGWQSLEPGAGEQDVQGGLRPVWLQVTLDGF